MHLASSKGWTDVTSQGEDFFSCFPFENQPETQGTQIYQPIASTKLQTSSTHTHYPLWFEIL